MWYYKIKIRKIGLYIGVEYYGIFINDGDGFNGIVIDLIRVIILGGIVMENIGKIWPWVRVAYSGMCIPSTGGKTLWSEWNVALSSTCDDIDTLGKDNILVGVRMRVSGNIGINSVFSNDYFGKGFLWFHCIPLSLWLRRRKREL